jgi:hypothetical protein
LLFLKGGSLSIDAGVTIVLNSLKACPDQQIFAGEGQVLFGERVPEYIYPDWWGVDGINDQNAINKALAASGDSETTFGYRRKGVVKLLAKSYGISDSILLNRRGQSLIGAGAPFHQTRILATSAMTAMIEVCDDTATDVSGIEIKYLLLHGAGNADYGISWGRINASGGLAHDSSIERVRTSYVYIGFYLYAADDIYLRDCEATTCTRHAIYIGNSNIVIMSGDYEYAGSHVVVCHGRLQMYGTKIERASGGVGIYLDTNQICYIETAISGAVYLSEKTRHCTIVVSGTTQLNQYNIIDNGINNTIKTSSPSNLFSFPFSSLTSDIGNDTDFSENGTAFWHRPTLVSDDWQTKLIKIDPNSWGLPEFSRSAQVSVKKNGTNDPYVYQDITIALDEDGEYLFISHTASPEKTGTDDYYLNYRFMMGAITLLDHDVHPPKSTETSERMEIITQRDFNVIKLDTTGTLTYRITPMSTADYPQYPYAIVGPWVLKKSILANGSMTSFTNNQPDNWDVIEGSTYLSQETSDQYSGDSCLKISGGKVRLRYNLSGLVTEGTEYLMGAHIKILNQTFIDYLLSTSVADTQRFFGMVYSSADGSYQSGTAYYQYSVGTYNAPTVLFPALEPGWQTVFGRFRPTSTGIKPDGHTEDYQNLWLTFDLPARSDAEVLIDDVFIVPIN